MKVGYLLQDLIKVHVDLRQLVAVRQFERPLINIHPLLIQTSFSRITNYILSYICTAFILEALALVQIDQSSSGESQS